MIYLIQPADYRQSIKELLERLLAQKHLPLKILSAIPKPRQVFNTYFIINDSQNTIWPALDYARAIRQQDKTGHLILLADQIDYTALFRSHLSFLAAIPFDQAPNEIQDYLDEFF